LRCRSCNASFSTRWEKDALALGQAFAPFEQKVDLKNIPSEFLTNVKQLKITGGEPFLEKSFKPWLSQVVQDVAVEEKEIEIFTNGTVFPDDEFLDALGRFGKVIISVSIDGYKDQNYYLRNPACWSDIEKNIELWSNWCRKHSSAELYIVMTISVYNILALFDLIHWLDSKGLHKIIFQLVHEPKWMSVERLPFSLKVAFLRAFQDRHKELLSQSNLPKLIHSRINRLEKLLLSEP
jgi:sulfatase maturation enzyme AslB (radical SAM superfamily)